MAIHNIIFGIRSVIEAIKNDSSINKVYLQRGSKGNLFFELQDLIKINRIPISFVPIEKLDRLSKYQNHQGVVAHISPVKFTDLEILIEEILEKKTKPLFIILDQISDVRNFGAIIRTAECTGVDGIIIQESGSAPINAETIKTSAGAAFSVPICRVNHIKDAIYLLQAHDIKIIAATEKTDNLIYNNNLKVSLALIMGSEGKGINPSVLKIVNEKVKLPLYGEIDSLNVSVACGAILYEVVRQRLS